MIKKEFNMQATRPQAALPIDQSFAPVPTSELRYPKIKGRYANTPFRIEERLEKSSNTTGKKCLEEFKSKGGQLVVLDPNTHQYDDRFVLLPQDIVYPSCTAALCRSQTLWTVLSLYSKNITLFPPHATRQGFDPYDGKSHWQENYEQDLEDDEFTLWNGAPKPIRFAYSEYSHLQRDEDPSYETLSELKEFHDKNYYGHESCKDAKDSRRVYITFSQNTHVILHRLNQTNPTFENLIVVSIDMDDFISNPLKEWHTLPRSVKTYENLAKILDDLIETSKL